MVGGTSIQQFQTSITVPSDTAFTLERLFVTLADDSGGNDEAPSPIAMVPVLFGPMILPGYIGYFEHEVVSSETLSALAQRYYTNATLSRSIHQANQNIDTNPNIIFLGRFCAFQEMISTNTYFTWP